MRKKILVAFLVILTIVIPLFIYWYNQSNTKTIVIENGSKYYDISYNKNPEFEKDLEAWGMWEKNNVFMDTDGEYHTVKKIIIYTTDSKQPYHYIEKPGVDDYLFSSSEEVDEKGVLHLKIYIGSQSIVENTEEEVANIFFTASLMRIIDITHEGAGREKVFQVFVDLKNKYGKMPGNMPFAATKKEK